MFDKKFEQMLNIERSVAANDQTKHHIDHKIKAKQKRATRQYYAVLSIATALAIILLISSLSSTTLPPQSAEMEKPVHIINSIALKDVDADKIYNLQSIFLLATRQNNSEDWLTKLEQLLQHLEPIENPPIDLSEKSADHLLVQYDNGQNTYFKILYDGSGTYVLDETNGQYYSSDPLHFIIRDYFKGLGIFGVLLLGALLVAIPYIGRRFFTNEDKDEPAPKSSSFVLFLMMLGFILINDIFGTIHFGFVGTYYFLFFVLSSLYEYKRYHLKTSLAKLIFMTISITLAVIIVYKI